ncbi:MAG: molecular chaperone HtpG [Verrucomicrobiota bacterium]
MSQETTEKHTFQAEVQQLLDIVIHSLYTDREIFLRELISNASDAMEKLRHVESTEKEIFDPKLSTEINITTDDTAKTITIADHGIGMTREELQENLGTIAHSGTKAFLQALKDKGSNGGDMIGQFGVGFYSAFMVADQVKVYTHSWREEGEHLVWTSDGLSGYEIEEAPGQRRGCRLVLELKDEYAEFAKEEKIKHLIETYSNFVGFPIFLNGTRINEVEALWLKSKGEVSEEEYGAFYKFQAKAFDEPLYRLHFNADAPITINSLIFLPSQNQERMGFGQMDPGVALYSRKVLIDPNPEGLLPEWLRFVKGVIDSADLPLNISRESMQDSALVKKLGEVITKRVLKMLDKEAKDDAEKYAKFYKQFQRFLKEGIANDFTHREALSKLLRFQSSMTEKGELTSFAEYGDRSKEEQKEIYYLVGASREQIEASPYLEAFKARGLEVVFFDDPIDEYVVNSLGEVDGKKLVSIDRGNVELEEAPVEGEALEKKEVDQLCKFLKDTLGERVTRVDSGKRLVDSPIVALVPEDGMNAQMRQMMKAMDENFSESVKVELEINPRHTLIKKLAQTKETNADLAKLVAEQLLDSALMSAGLLEDAKDVVRRNYEIMEKAL